MTEVIEEEVIAFTKRNPTPTGGFKKQVTRLFKEHVGRPIQVSLITKHIKGIDEHTQSYAPRRLKEIHDDDRLPLVNCKHPDGIKKGLKIGQWMLLSLTPISDACGRGVNKKITSQVFTRDNSTCTRCGAKPGEKHHNFPDKQVRRHVGHLIPRKKDLTDAPGKKYTVDDFTTLCSMCNEGEQADVFSKEQIISMLLKQREAIDKQLSLLQGAS